MNGGMSISFDSLVAVTQRSFDKWYRDFHDFLQVDDVTYSIFSRSPDTGMSCFNSM